MCRHQDSPAPIFSARMRATKRFGSSPSSQTFAASSSAALICSVAKSIICALKTSSSDAIYTDSNTARFTSSRFIGSLLLLPVALLAVFNHVRQLPHAPHNVAEIAAWWTVRLGGYFALALHFDTLLIKSVHNSLTRGSLISCGCILCLGVGGESGGLRHWVAFLSHVRKAASQSAIVVP